MTVREGRAALKKHRAELRRTYASFHRAAEHLRGKELVRYNRDKHRYEDCIHAATRSVSAVERAAVRDFLRLQTNIASQAVLMLEMEHAIKHHAKSD